MSKVNLKNFFGVIVWIGSEACFCNIREYASRRYEFSGFIGTKRIWGLCHRSKGRWVANADGKGGYLVK